MLFGPGIFHPARVVFSVTAIPRSQRRQHHISSKKSVRILWCEGHAPTERDCERDRPPPPPTPPTLLTHCPVGTTPSPKLPSRSVPFQWCPLKKLLLLLWYCYEPLNIYMSFPATIRPNKLCQTHKPLPSQWSLILVSTSQCFLKIYSTHLVWFYSDIIETLHTQLELNKTISAVTEVSP